MSDRSFRGYSRVRWLFSPVLRLVDCLCVQGDRDQQRYLALGVAQDCVLVTGSAKYDVALKSPGNSEQATLILRTVGMSASDLILLGGSTWPGEEEALLDYFKEARQRYPGLKLVLVPRHAERRDEVVAAIQRRGLRFVQRSTGMTEQGGGCPEVLLVDTTGELKHLYTAATVIFVGKSLIQHGGQNIIEPAACGKPVVVGPNMENFADITDEFKAGGGLIQVADGAGLIRALDELFAEGSLREGIGNRAMSLVLKNRGSLTITVQRAKQLSLLSGRLTEAL
jgi:3-deoxy-D-manno-octulosonic-acid transferase